MPITDGFYAFVTKPMPEWTMMDLQLFNSHVEEIAADGDLAVKRPELREMALEIIARKNKEGAAMIRYYIKAEVTLVISVPEKTEEEAREIVKATIQNMIENGDLDVTADIGGILHDYDVSVGVRFNETD